MEFLQAMWLPIVVSAVFVWIASFLTWMVLPLHKGEWKGVSDEKGFLGALIEMGVQPGNYMFPHAATPERMKDPEFQEMMNRGPTGIMTVWGGPPKMGLYMLVTLALYMVVSLFVAYVAAHTLAPSDPYLTKFRITGAMAVGIYTLGKLPHDVWFRTPKGSVMRQLLDGVIYGLVTAGTFGWLWKE
jgi:hypothetical protein